MHDLRVAKKKPYLRLANKREKYKRQNNTDTGQRKVGKRCSKDESKFEVFGSQRRTFVRS